MNKKEPKKNKKKLRLKIDVLIKCLLFLLLIGFFAYYMLSLNVQNIKITGNTNIKDVDIIEKANIKDYPNIYRLNIKKIKEDIKTIPLVKDVKIKRNVFGKITIDITEDKILFFYKYNNKYITSSGESIPDSNEYFGYPTLINFTPDTIFESFVDGLNKVDYNIIKMINEIEYSPYKSSEGIIIDNNHFTLKMNDTNTVMIDTVNIKNLNKYQTIIASPDMDKSHGIIYLDTINDDRIYIKSYETIAKEEQEALAKKESHTSSQEQ